MCLKNSMPDERPTRIVPPPVRLLLAQFLTKSLAEAVPNSVSETSVATNDARVGGFHRHQPFTPPRTPLFQYLTLSLPVVFFFCCFFMTSPLLLPLSPRCLRRTVLQEMSSKSVREEAKRLVFRVMMGKYKIFCPFVVAIKAEILIVRLQ